MIHFLLFAALLHFVFDSDINPRIRQAQSRRCSAAHPCKAQ